MAHDVFISYSSKDRATADSVLAALEDSGIDCWIAPRDILPGTISWPNAILAAIASSRVVVLVFSGNCNDSPAIEREVDRAINKRIPLVPVRIENVRPQGALEFLLATAHWFDAFALPGDVYLGELIRITRTLLDCHEDAFRGFAVSHADPRKAPWRTPRRAMIRGATAAVASAVGVLAYRLYTPDRVSVVPQPANGESSDAKILLNSDFDDPIDNETWDFPHFAPVNNSTFYGRTQIRPGLPSAAGGVAHLTLDTYDPFGPGATFLGTEMSTRQKFVPEINGIAFEASARLNQAAPGLAGGVFVYNYHSDIGTHDEVGFELLSNSVAASRHEVRTNFYRGENSGVGHPLVVPNVDLTQFHTYRIELFRDKIKWFVDRRLVRTETLDAGLRPITLRLNFWAPAADWREAFSARLQPVATATQNTTYQMLIEFVRIAELAPH